MRMHGIIDPEIRSRRPMVRSGGARGAAFAPDDGRRWSRSTESIATSNEFTTAPRQSEQI